MHMQRLNQLIETIVIGVISGLIAAAIWAAIVGDLPQSLNPISIWETPVKIETNLAVVWGMVSIFVIFGMGIQFLRNRVALSRLQEYLRVCNDDKNHMEARIAQLTDQRDVIEIELRRYSNISSRIVSVLEGRRRLTGQQISDEITLTDGNDVTATEVQEALGRLIQAGVIEGVYTGELELASIYRTRLQALQPYQR